MAWIISAVLFLCWGAYIGRHDGSADSGGLKHLLYRIWRRLAFWAGDVRFWWEWYFGFIPLPRFSWAHHEYAITYETLLDACKRLQPGDIMLATKKGYIFSNSAIPGCFKHAGIIVQGPDSARVQPVDPPDRPFSTPDLARVQLVEAISEGVVRRHPLWARGDLMIFLRPKHAQDKDREKAVEIAHAIVGCKYDASFKFNMEEELKLLAEQEESPLVENVEELHRSMRNLRSEYDMSFSCTEVVATAWWHMRKRLGIARKKVRGRLCITADQFLNRDFKVVWTNVTVGQAEKAGLGEEGVRELKAYWNE